MAQNLGNIYVSINARLAKLKADLKKAEAMSRASGMKMNAAMNLGKAKKGLKSFNVLLTATFAGVGLLAVTRFAKSIVSIGTEFQHSMLIVKGVTRATGKQFVELTDLAKKLGETTEWTANQAAGGLKFLGMAGLGAERSLEALPGMLDLATAGAIELATAADIATNAMTAMQIPVEELNRVNDVFIGTITRSNTNMEMMAESFKYSAPLAKAYGVSIETLAAMIGTLGNAGIQGSMAGTQLAFAFQKTQKVFEKLGIDGAGKSFVDALKAARDAGWGATEMMQAFGMRGGRAALVLKDLVPMVEDLEGKLKNSEGEAKKLAETMRSSTKTAFIELKSAIEGIAISAFAENTGSLNEAIRHLTKTIRDGKEDWIFMAGIMVKMAAATADMARGAIHLKDYFVPGISYRQGEIKERGLDTPFENLAGMATGDIDPRTGERYSDLRKKYARSGMSEHERRRLGLAAEDTESQKRATGRRSPAMLTDMWKRGSEAVPRFNASDNIDWDALKKKQLESNHQTILSLTDMWATFNDEQTQKASEASIAKADALASLELPSNRQTVLALTDMWATFNDEQTQKASEASIAKAEAIKEQSTSTFDHLTQLSQRTAWAMQANFSSFFFDAMKGELTSLKDLATSVFDSILKAFADMAGQMAVEGLFGLLPKVTGGGGSSGIDKFIGTFMHEGGVVGGAGIKKQVPASLFMGAPRLHNGLAPDEVPAILQKGETVIPKGGGDKGMVINQNPNITIVAQDAASFADMTNRNPGAILAPVMQAIQEGNMPLISAIRGVM